jgi:hypothetical protein
MNFFWKASVTHRQGTDFVTFIQMFDSDQFPVPCRDNVSRTKFVSQS